MVSSIIPTTERVLRLNLEKGGPGRVLGPMELSLVAGETVALTGPSGAGKTSLLRIIAGLDKRFDGRLETAGRIAIVFQEPVLLPWRTALQNLTIVARINETEAQHWLEKVDLGGLGARFPGMLSLGQQRRLALARAFASKPDLLLMDEPFVSLDPALVDEMMGLFEQLIAARPCATLFVTHVKAEAERLASRILRLECQPARLVEEDQNAGAYFRLSASGVTTSRS